MWHKCLLPIVETKDAFSKTKSCNYHSDNWESSTKCLLSNCHYYCLKVFYCHDNGIDRRSWILNNEWMRKRGINLILTFSGINKKVLLYLDLSFAWSVLKISAESGIAPHHRRVKVMQKCNTINKMADPYFHWTWSLAKHCY